MKQNTVAIIEKPKHDNNYQRAWRRIRKHHLAMFGLVVLTLFILMAVFALSAQRTGLKNRGTPPSLEHWFGTDRTGRDVWARVWFGGCVSLSLGLIAVAISTLIGVIVGSVAGYVGGAVDMILMRITDTVQSFTTLVIIIVLVAVVGPSIYNSMFAIGILDWPTIVRIIRSEFLSLREQEFVLAAQALGVPNSRIIFRHIFPNALSSTIVAVTFAVGTGILMEAALSFLGLGVQIPTASWGNMLQDAQSLSVMEGMPWMWIPPGVLIALTVLSINFIGDGLRDSLDPKTVG